MASTRFSSAMRSAAIVGLRAALVGEVQALGAAGEHLAGRGRLAVPDEQDRGERVRGSASSLWPWSASNLLSGP